MPEVRVTTEFEEFVAAVTPSLRRLALVLCGGNVADAEDLVQGSLERILMKWGSLDIKSPVTYARTVLLNEQRSQRRRLRWSREVLVAVTPDAADTVASTDIDVRQTLVRALRILPMRQRQAVVLRYLEDMSVPEVARLLGCSQGTIKRAGHDGLRALQANLDHHDLEEQVP